MSQGKQSICFRDCDASEDDDATDDDEGDTELCDKDDDEKESCDNDDDNDEDVSEDVEADTSSDKSSDVVGSEVEGSEDALCVPGLWQWFCCVRSIEKPYEETKRRYKEVFNGYSKMGQRPTVQM